jgi:hypothetical protein
MKKHPRVILLGFLLGLISAQGTAVPAPAIPPESCQGQWILTQAHKYLGQPYFIFDFSNVPQSFADDVESGRTNALTDTLIVSLRRGEASTSYVLLAGPTSTVGPILRKIIPTLSGSTLPYLTLLLVGPPEYEQSAGASIRALGGSFVFVPFEQHECSEKPAKTN